MTSQTGKHIHINKQRIFIHTYLNTAKYLIKYRQGGNNIWSVDRL